MTTKRKVIAYCRVSTDQQVDGTSLQSQQERIIAYCHLHQWDVVEVIVDGGESGKSLDRPGMLRVRELIRTRQADGLVVASLDRLSRDQADTFGLMKELGKKDAALVSIREGIDTSTLGGNLVLSVMAMLASNERENIVYRIKTAHKAKRAKGERMGKIPYGYTAPDGCHLVEEPAEQAMLARVRELRAEGLSYRKMSAVLAGEGHVSREGTPFLAAQLQRFCDRA